MIRTMDGSDNIGVYGEAKAEYTRQLCSFLVPALEQYFLDLLAEVKETEKDPKRILWVFQDALKQFPDWNIDKVHRETEKVQNATHCDYLEEILTAVFIAHTKVLSAIRLTSKQKKLQITIPKIDHFLHRTMSECARLLWSSAYLFAETGPAVERQKNLRQVGQLLHEGVLQSIRGMVPVKSILKEYLTDDGDEGVTEAAPEAQAQEEETETAPVVHEESVVAPPVAEEAPEKAAEPIPEPVPEPVVAVLENVHEESDQKGGEVPGQQVVAPPPAPSAPPVPTIVVDTEPPTVGFTHMDAVLDTDHPDQSTIQLSNQIDDNEDQEITHIEVDTNAPPEAIDEFEDLEESQPLAVGQDEFETL
jgi:hypothetical protein